LAACHCAAHVFRILAKPHVVLVSPADASIISTPGLIVSALKRPSAAHRIKYELGVLTEVAGALSWRPLCLPRKRASHSFLNQNHLDIRRENLGNIQGTKNPKPKPPLKYGVAGVGWSKRSGKWQARVKGIDGVSRHVGFFADFEVACAAAEPIRALAIVRDRDRALNVPSSRRHQSKRNQTREGLQAQ
jgi:hypothetical protein